MSGTAGRRLTASVAGEAGRARAARLGRRAAATLAAGGLWLVAATALLAAEPSSSPAGRDVRTTPAAPGLVGDPLFAIVGVALVAALAVTATLLATRLAERR